MYDIIFDGELFWITYNGKKLEELGGFVDCISPRIIIKEIENEV